MLRNIGRFMIDRETIEDYPKFAAEILKGILIVECSYNFAANAFEYIGCADYFEIVPKGSVPELYYPIIHSVAASKGQGRFLEFKGFRKLKQ